MHSAVQKVQFIILVLFSFFVLWLGGCEQPSVEEQRLQGSILFPSDGGSIIYGSPLVLRADLECGWFSQIDGFLGLGKTITVDLSEGEHLIRLMLGDVLLDSISFSVAPFDDNRMNFLIPLIGRNPEVMLSSGNWQNAILSLELQSVSYHIPIAENVTDTSLIDTAAMLIKDPTFTSPSRRAILQSQNRAIGDSISLPVRDFRMVDINGGNDSEGLILSASLVASTNSILLWSDSENPITDFKAQDFIDELEAAIVYHRQIWGGWNDLNQDGKISILMSHELNDSGMAIGFFNPADFYMYQPEQDSEEYNPNSNEMDILYIACPSDESGAFSRNSIIATVLHEFTHLSNYSRIFQQERDYPLSNILVEEVFIEEGLAHLSESLSGYGISGGNMAFVARYLANSSTVSMSSLGLYGLTDGIEKRGAMALFLSWVFWNQGGIVFHDTNISDLGGIAWIQRYHSSLKRGWERIEESTGTSRQVLLQCFTSEILNENLWSDLVHPISGEPVTINPFYGPVRIFEKDYDLDGLGILETAEFKQLPFSIIRPSNINLDDSASLIFHSEEGYSRCFAFFVKEKY